MGKDIANHAQTYEHSTDDPGCRRGLKGTAPTSEKEHSQHHHKRSNDEQISNEACIPLGLMREKNLGYQRNKKEKTPGGFKYYYGALIGHAALAFNLLLWAVVLWHSDISKAGYS